MTPGTFIASFNKEDNKPPPSTPPEGDKEEGIPTWKK
jgi:hypothetical protein